MMICLAFSHYQKIHKQKISTLLLIVVLLLMLPLFLFPVEKSFDYQLFQSHGAIMLLIEPESGRIVDANQSAVDFYGYSAERFQNMTIEEINMLTPSQVEQERLAAEREDRNYFIFPHLLANGETKNVEVYSWPVSWQGQTLLFSIIHDISKRAEALEMVMEKERTLSSIFRGAPLIIGVAVNRDFVEINQTVEKILGYTPDEMINKDSRFLYESEEEYERVKNALYPAEEKTTGSVETQWFHKNGELVDVLITSSYLDPKDPSLGITFTVRDISEEKATEKSLSKQRRIFFTWLLLILLIQLLIIVALILSIRTRKKLEKSLRESKQKAEEASQAKSIFLANMSHELRTPLNGIIGFSEILKETPISNNQRHYVETIIQSGRALLEIINDILDLSKIEAGKMAIVQEKMDLFELIDSCLNIVKYKAIEKGIEMKKEIVPNVPQWIETDPVRMKQILLNLLSNAVKFTQEGYVTLKLTVVAKEEGKKRIKLDFSVIDTGIGIKKENLAKIFKAFNQGDDSTTRKFGGTGLGLTITNSLLHKMGSKLMCESVEGKGSTFSFEIDVVYFDVPDKPQKFLELKEKSPHLPASGKTILVVEDNAINMRLMCTRLKLLDKSLNVIEAKTGQEAIEAFKQEKPDLVFTDIKLPDIDGYQVAKELHQLDSNIPIIALSALAWPVDKEKRDPFGIKEFIKKPFSETEIRRVLKSFL